MEMDMDDGILLKTGTGELEILEFIINNKHYAINIIKVKEVIDVDNLTKIPQSCDSLAGLILYRNEILPLVDLRFIVNGTKDNCTNTKVIICEFNKMKVAFNLDKIVGIHRIKWHQIVKPDDLSNNSLVTGNIIYDDKIILLLDFEKIVTDINPKTGINQARIEDIEYKDRSKTKIALADDSPLIRQLLKDTLTKAGFSSFKIFNDGKQALDYLENLVKEKGECFIDDVNVLITDVEMPQMDGHTLTRKIKENPILKKLPVIIFSSLITDNLKHKGESVGADAQVSKPEVENLVGLIDKLCK